MNPIKFYDDIISDVISGDIALWAYEHDNWTIFHPISTKLGMVDVIWVLTNPIEWRHDDIISDVIADRFQLE